MKIYTLVISIVLIHCVSTPIVAQRFWPGPDKLEHLTAKVKKTGELLEFHVWRSQSTVLKLVDNDSRSNPNCRWTVDSKVHVSIKQVNTILPYRYHWHPFWHLTSADGEWEKPCKDGESESRWRMEFQIMRNKGIAIHDNSKLIHEHIEDQILKDSREKMEFTWRKRERKVQACDFPCSN